MSFGNRGEATMADRTGSQEPPRPVIIPDGGLGSALPEWMQVKPEWAEREDVRPVATVRHRPIPTPDTSPIVLADILTVDDMPDWLRSVAARPVAADEVTTTTVDSEATPEPVTVAARTEPLASAVPAHPWWASDRMMAGLLIAVILTILFVLFTAITLM